VFSFRLPISVVVALGLASSGCSFCFVTPPPVRHSQPVARPEADCSTSVAAPVIDGLITGYQVFRTGYAFQASDSDYRGAPISRGADIGIGLGMTALFLASTIYGGVNVAHCKRLKNGPPDKDHTNDWHLDQGAPEPWQSPRPAAPAAPNERPAPAQTQADGQPPPPPPAVPATAAPAAPAPTAPTPAPAPAAPSASMPAPAPSATPAPAPSAPPKAAFPDPP
jgi:hypothetical protein